ncbi:MAG: DUF6134 family protein [Woeseiaceae bacterium]|nr:DUF6134 family protein [Woeseiaceae bacterium]
MKRKSLGLVMLGLFALTFTAPSESREKSRWEFNVYLDQKRIGSHSFEVTSVSGVTEVVSEARFKYTILLIPAYRYEHTAAERWSNNCLVGLDANTNANGDRIQVSGERTGGSFTVLTDEQPAYLPECVMSFAYWNPEFLDQPRLLNPQTGEYVAVQVEEAGSDVLQIRGESVSARRYRLTAYEVDLTLWYSEDDEWLGLESVAEGGRIIRYELS